MQFVGWLLLIGGLVLTVIGIVILLLGAIQLMRQMYHTAGGGGAAAPAAPGVNLADLTKLIEAIIKIPQWLLAILAGDAQIWFGYWLVTGTRLF